MVLITSTCLFLAYLIRRKCLGHKKGEDKDSSHHGKAATGAGGLSPKNGAAAGVGAWVRRHGKALIGAAAVLALASGAVLVLSKRSRAALRVVEGKAALLAPAVEGSVTGEGKGDDVSFLLSAAAPAAGSRREQEAGREEGKKGKQQQQQQQQQAAVAPAAAPQDQLEEASAGTEQEEGEGEEDEEEEAVSSLPAAGQCRVAAVAPCITTSEDTDPQQQQQQQQPAAGDWAVALSKLAGAVNATSIADLIVFQQQGAAAAPAATAIWPRPDALPSDIGVYVSGVVGGPPEASKAPSSPDARMAALPGPWDPRACPAPPRWRCAAADDAKDKDAAGQARSFDLVVLRGPGVGAAPLRLVAAVGDEGDEGAALLRALVLGGKGGGEKGQAAPRFLALTVAANDEAEACPDACSSKQPAAIMRPQCAPWGFPAPVARVPVVGGAEGGGMEVAVYRVEEDLAPLVRAWPAVGGLC